MRVAAERTGWTASTIYAWCRNVGVTPKPMRAVAQHGSRSMYGKGCRCDECREGNRVAVMEQRKRRLAGPIPAFVRHGTASTYTNWSCRCEPCTAANTEFNRPYAQAWRERQKASA